MRDVLSVAYRRIYVLALSSLAQGHVYTKAAGPGHSRARISTTLKRLR